jgi:hypothetical protein
MKKIECCECGSRVLTCGKSATITTVKSFTIQAPDHNLSVFFQGRQVKRAGEKICRPGTNVIKLFLSVIYRFSYWARVFVRLDYKSL